MFDALSNNEPVMLFKKFLFTRHADFEAPAMAGCVDWREHFQRRWIELCLNFNLNLKFSIRLLNGVFAFGAEPNTRSTILCISIRTLFGISECGKNLFCFLTFMLDWISHFAFLFDLFHSTRKVIRYKYGRIFYLIEWESVQHNQNLVYWYCK